MTVRTTLENVDSFHFYSKKINIPKGHASCHMARQWPQISFFQNFLCLESNKRNKLTFYLLTHWPNYLPTYLLILKTVKGFHPDDLTQSTYVTYTYLSTYLRNRSHIDFSFQYIMPVVMPCPLNLRLRGQFRTSFLVHEPNSDVWYWGNIRWLGSTTSYDDTTKTERVENHWILCSAMHREG